MIKSTLLMVTFLALVAAVAPAATPSTTGPAVAEVIVFEAGTSVPKFMEMSKRADAIAAKYGSSGKARTWISAFSGQNAGSIIVVVEYPSLSALAQSTEKMRGSAEWQQLVADAEAASLKRVSDSIIVELRPGM